LCHKFDENYKFFPCKKAYYVKIQDFFQIFFVENGFLWSRYGAGAGTGAAIGAGTGAEQEP
jgi:hypothetical protein